MVPKFLVYTFVCLRPKGLPPGGMQGLDSTRLIFQQMHDLMTSLLKNLEGGWDSVRHGEMKPEARTPNPPHLLLWSPNIQAAPKFRPPLVIPYQMIPNATLSKICNALHYPAWWHAISVLEHSVWIQLTGREPRIINSINRGTNINSKLFRCQETHTKGAPVCSCWHLVIHQKDCSLTDVSMVLWVPPLSSFSSA